MDALILANKALMALVTELGADFFEEDAEAVLRHFLPSFMDASKLKYPFVSKPVYGYQGKEVTIYKNQNGVCHYPDADCSVQPKLYQAYVELPRIVMDQKSKILLFTCFLVNGQAVGVSARVDDQVINFTSNFLPIGY